MLFLCKMYSPTSNNSFLSYLLKDVCCQRCCFLVRYTHLLEAPVIYPGLLENVWCQEILVPCKIYSYVGSTSVLSWFVRKCVLSEIILPCKIYSHVNNTGYLPYKCSLVYSLLYQRYCLLVMHTYIPATPVISPILLDSVFTVRRIGQLSPLVCLSELLPLGKIYFPSIAT